MNKLLLILIALVSLHAIGAENAWLGPDKSKWPDTEFRKTKNDFAAFLLVTPDTDWEKKWNIRPNGTVSVDTNDIPCMKEKLLGNPNNIRLSPAIIKFVGEKADPLGKWLVEVEVEDVNRKTLLQLKTYFVLEGKGG